MRKGKTVIVGAGLAGLTAAINLARGGREVLVLEKGKKVGAAGYNPSLHGTPLDVEAMRRYTGIDLAPAMTGLDEVIVSLWGERFTLRFPSNARAWMVERGPRRSSMDHYLYRLALEEGVSFEFDRPVVDERQLRDMPPGTILATGLHVEGFEAAGLPYRILHGCFARGRVPSSDPRVTVYFDDYTPDYAFTCSLNGIAFGLIFNRERPVETWETEKFAEQAARCDGYAFGDFVQLERGAVPLSGFNNPRLFQENKILAGTLAGMIDPILLFGMHGAFVSGKLAARALSDPGGADREFRRLNRGFYPLLAAKRLAGIGPHGMFMKHPARLAMRLLPHVDRLVIRRAFKINICGYGRLGTE